MVLQTRRHEERTLLVLKEATSAECAYHKAHLTVKPGFWCMHVGSRKFFATDRFITVKRISVTEALTMKDSPIVLRAEYEKQINNTLRNLRALNSRLTQTVECVHLRAEVMMNDNSM